MNGHVHQSLQWDDRCNFFLFVVYNCNHERNYVYIKMKNIFFLLNDKSNIFPFIWPFSTTRFFWLFELFGATIISWTIPNDIVVQVHRVNCCSTLWAQHLSHYNGRLSLSQSWSACGQLLEIHGANSLQQFQVLAVNSTKS